MSKLFSRFRKGSVNLNTEFARSRMARSMPGEVAALSAARYGAMTL